VIPTDRGLGEVHLGFIFPFPLVIRGDFVPFGDVDRVSGIVVPDTSDGFRFRRFAPDVAPCRC
jgi:hypothetical protein